MLPNTSSSTYTSPMSGHPRAHILIGATFRCHSKESRSGFWCCLLSLALLHAASGAPTNDLCSDAELIPGSGPFPYYSVVIPDVSDATTVGDPPVPSCSAGGVSRSIWYQFAPV